MILRSSGDELGNLVVILIKKSGHDERWLEHVSAGHMRLRNGGRDEGGVAPLETLEMRCPCMPVTVSTGFCCRPSRVASSSGKPWFADSPRAFGCADSRRMRGVAGVATLDAQIC